MLIHEATFQDGMEEDAHSKVSTTRVVLSWLCLILSWLAQKHATVGQAIKIASQMNSRALLMTHFSARYPKLPEFGDRVRGALVWLCATISLCLWIRA